MSKYYIVSVADNEGLEVYSQVFTKLDVKRLVKEINDAYWTEVLPATENEKPEG